MLKITKHIETMLRIKGLKLKPKKDGCVTSVNTII